MNTNLSATIEAKRRMMMAAGEVLGLNHKVTLKLSEELDKLIIEAMKKEIAV